MKDLMIEHWSEAMPTEEGWYWFMCYENDFKPEKLKIHHKGDHFLLVDCPFLGNDQHLIRYHEGLGNPIWRKEHEKGKAITANIGN